MLGTLTRNIKRYKTALYAGTDEYTVVPGMMILWDGALTGLPTDWYLCDGVQAGAPDMTDHFIEIAASGSEDTSEVITLCHSLARPMTWRTAMNPVVQ